MWSYVKNIVEVDDNVRTNKVRDQSNWRLVRTSLTEFEQGKEPITDYIPKDPRSKRISLMLHCLHQNLIQLITHLIQSVEG